jgi:hypothetical protein
MHITFPADGCVLNFFFLGNPDVTTPWTVFGPMKVGLRGQHFPDNDAVIAAVRKWLASAGANFYECGIQALVHRWQK